MKGKISRLFRTIRKIGRLNLWILVGAAVLALVSCGGGGGTTTSGTTTTKTTITSVSVMPSTSTLVVNQSQQFQATVTGTGNFSTQVQWSVNDISGGNSTYGTITGAGLYTAPAAVPGSGPVTIKATSTADSSKSGTASVTIGAENVQVSVSPATTSVQLNAMQGFTATVTGTANTSVAWGVNNVMGGLSRTGVISQYGMYTAPTELPLDNTVTITATSQEDPSRSASAQVTLLATAGGITVTISPQSPNVTFDGTQTIQFTATVTGTSNTGVNWSVDPYYANVGQIDSNGLFTPATVNCSTAPAFGLIRAVSVDNSGAQGVSQVNFVPPTPVITSISPQPAAFGDTLNLSGTFDPGAKINILYPGPGGVTIPVATAASSTSTISMPVPLGVSSGSLSLQQVCVSDTGVTFPTLTSNSVPFTRIPRPRIRADRQVLTSGESIQMKVSFLGDPLPEPMTWSAVNGSVTPDGVYTASGGSWDKVTGCITGTQQCDFFVFSILPSRIDPEVPVVQTGSTLQLSDLQGSISLTPTWNIVAGGGSIDSSGLYTAPASVAASGAIPITATTSTGSATNAIGVTGAFLGMVNRLEDFPDLSANATGETTIPIDLAIDGNHLYVRSDNLPTNYANGHYEWIDVYDISDEAHPVWQGAVEGLPGDLDIHPLRMFASGGLLWRVSPIPFFQSRNDTSAVAIYDTASGLPVLTRYLSLPGWATYSFHQGLLVGIPASLDNYGQSTYQSPVTAQVLDARTGSLLQSQISLELPNGGAPAYISSMAITGTRLFLVVQQAQGDGTLPFYLATYDLTSNPPSLLQTLSLSANKSGSFGGLARIFGNLLFAAPTGADGGFSIYDISRGLPVFLTPLKTDLPVVMTGPLGLVPMTHQAISPGSGYRLVDFADLAQPKLTGLVFDGNDQDPGPAVLTGTHAYVRSSGIQVFDITAPGGPLPETAIQGSGVLGTIYDMAASASDLWVGEDVDTPPNHFVTTFDLNQTPPQKISSFPLNNETPLALSLDGNYLFVGTSAELMVLDVSNPASPVELNSLPLPTSALALVGNTLFDGTTDNRLVAVDVTNPESPVAGTSTSLAGFPVIVRANGNLLYIAADTAGLLTYDVSNPSAPALLSQYLPAGSSAVEGVSLDGNLALLAATDGGFVIANVTDPSAPFLAGQYPLSALACYADLAAGLPGIVSISSKGGIAYAGTANLNAEVYGLDYTNPAHPRLVSVADYANILDNVVLSFAFDQSDLFVGGDLYYDEVRRADISQPRNFIRHMCLPPAFSGSALSPFPEVTHQMRMTTQRQWNPKISHTQTSKKR